MLHVNIILVCRYLSIYLLSLYCICLQIVFKNEKDSGKVHYILKEDHEKKRCNGTSDTSLGMHKLCSLVVINSLGLEKLECHVYQ